MFDQAIRRHLVDSIVRAGNSPIRERQTSWGRLGLSGAGAVAAVGVLWTALLVLLVMHDGDPSEFLRLGVLHPVTTEYAVPRLGEVVLMPEAGHDGKFFYVQAHDPLLLNPKAHAEFLDRPVYRSQRMLYPALAGPGMIFGEWGIVWALLIVNLIAMGFGTWGTSKLAESMGASRWWGMAFSLNPGMLFEVLVDGSGVVAWSLAVGGLWLWETDRRRGAVGALAAACLAREAMALVALGMGAFVWRREGRVAARPLLWPLAAALGWGVYVRVRLGYPLWEMQSKEVGAPFSGWLQAAASWPEEGLLDLVMGVVLVMLVVAVVYQSRVRPSTITWAALGFALVSPLLTQAVWLHHFDIARAVAPLFTLFALAAGQRFSRDDAGPLRRSTLLSQEAALTVDTSGESLS